MDMPESLLVERCSLLTLSEIPRTIGVSIRLKQRDTHTRRETRFLEETGFLIAQVLEGALPDEFRQQH